MPTYLAAIQNSFNLQDEEYNCITAMFPISRKLPIENIFQGDCFLNRTVFRSHHWKMIPEIHKDKDWYNHGYVMSFISENTVNTQMRTDTTAGGITYTYFPKCLTNSVFGTLLKWAVDEESDDVKSEACYVNAGYNRLYSENVIKGYNKYLPYIPTSYPNRIWPSSKQTPGSFINNFRLFGISSYKDFPWEDGPINSVVELYGKLVSICDRAINEHYYNESQYRVPTSQGELLLGQTDILAEQCRKIAPFGSKHTHGILSVLSGIVGIDTDKNIIWRVMPGDGGLVAENMSQKYQIESEFRKQVELIKSYYKIGDTPSWGNGVVIGYDPTYKEIHFSIVSGYQPTTFTFSEEINAFLGNAPFVYHTYINDGKEFYSANKGVSGASGGLYQHNNKKCFMVFSGVLKPMILSIMVNGLSEQGNTSQLRKIFKSGSMIAGPQPFESIDINTLFQHGQLNPFKNDVQFWKTAEYNNGMWEYPLPLQDSDENNQFQTETDMRGFWAKLTFTYRSTANTFIQSIRTLFNTTSI